MAITSAWPLRQSFISGSARYGHAAALIGSGLAAGLATTWAALDFWAQAALVWLVLEAIFYLQQHWRYARTSGYEVEDAAIDPARQKIVEDRLLELGAIFGIEEFMSGWFKGAPFEAIHRGNVEDFIAYGFSCKRADQLSKAERQHASEYIGRVEATFGVRFPEGRNPHLEFMAHLWEPLRWIHKPLLLFIGAELMWLATDALLCAQGFRPHWHDGLRYWIMEPLVVRDAAAAAEAAGQSAGSSRCDSSTGSSPSLASPLSRSTCSSGAASPEEDEGGVSVHTPPLEALDEEPSAQALNGGSMAAAAVVSPVTLAAHTLRRLVQRRPRLSLDVWDSVSSLPKFGPGSRRSGRRDAPDSSPIFFIHGVGFGLTPYLHFVAELMRAFPTRPMVLLEARHVSVCLHTHCHSTDEMAAAAAHILAKHGWRQAAFMGHSYGTFVLSRIAQLHRPLVQSMVLLDPVCMLTIYPQLLRNFVYKLPDWAHMASLLGLVDSLRFVFSRDLMVAESFCRKFVWHRECLWPEDLPDACMLVLAANDDLVPSALVRAMLAKMNHPCEVLYHPTAGHGGFLLSHTWRRQIIANIKVTVATGADLAAKGSKAQ